jgi:hypothetical protein
MDFNDDIHIDVCQNIEVGLKVQYETFPELTDNLCILGLDNAVIAIKQHYSFAKNERVSDNPTIGGIIEWCVEVGVGRIGNTGELTLKEYVALIATVKKSVIRHSAYGARAYYDFIKDYV